MFKLPRSQHSENSDLLEKLAIDDDTAQWVNTILLDPQFNGLVLEALTIEPSDFGDIISDISLETLSQASAPAREDPSDLLRAPAALKECTLAQIHTIIRLSKCILHASKAFQSNYPTLERLLSKFSDDGTPLTYEFLKHISPEDLEKRYPTAYHLPIPSKKINIYEYSLDDIYKHIKENNNITKAASSLGVTANTLKTHIQQYKWNKKTLNYSLLESMAPSDLIDIQLTKKSPVRKHPHSEKKGSLSKKSKGLQCPSMDPIMRNSPSFTHSKDTFFSKSGSTVEKTQTLSTNHRLNVPSNHM